MKLIELHTDVRRILGSSFISVSRTTTRRSSSTGSCNSPKNWIMPSSSLNHRPDLGTRNHVVPIQHPQPRQKLPSRLLWTGNNPPSHGLEQPLKPTSHLSLAIQESPLNLQSRHCLNQSLSPHGSAVPSQSATVMASPHRGNTAMLVPKGAT